MKKESILQWFRGNTGKILISLFEIIIGILLFVNPIGFTSGIIITCGAVMLLLGLANVIKYFTTKAEIAANEKALFSGLLLLTIGCFCVFKSEWFTNMISVISVLYGIVLVLLAYNSIQSTVDMLRAKRKKWFLELLNAVILTVFAIIIFINPFGAGKGIWIFIGVVLIVSAIYTIVEMILFSRPERTEPKAKKQAKQKQADTQAAKPQDTDGQ